MNFVQLPVTIFSITPYSDTISKARALIFYKGLNRNGGYIDDNFADHLLSTAPYAPIKGIYQDNDFTDHGESRTEGRIYGVVAAEPNTAWETKLDKDGVERTYAAVDVLLYTALYPEANEIVGKSLSMELYKKSISGTWEYVDGARAFRYKTGSFLGLQALGENVEPCFQGAAFYSLNNEQTINEIKEAIDKYSRVLDNLQKEENNQPMEDFIFQLSFDEIRGKLAKALNPNVREGATIYENFIDIVYSNAVVFWNAEEDKFYRANYSIGEDGVVTLGDKEEVFIMDVSQSERDVLDAIRVNYALDTLETVINEFKDNADKISAKNLELENSIATLNMTVEQNATQLADKDTELATLRAQVESLIAENSTLSDFKKAVIDQQKQSIIDSYAALLDAEVIAQYRAAETFEKFDAEGLDKELAYELKKNNTALFMKQEGQQEPSGFPKDNATGSSISEILEKYKNKNK